MPLSTLNHRLSLLLEHGLVLKEDETSGYYAITDRGRAYLAGEIDAEALEGPD